MCDCLVALPASTVDGVTLFAKNSDRPPTERQVLERLPRRRERVTRTTYLEIDGRDGETFAVVGTRPAWMWGLEMGVNEASVAAGNATIYTTLDPRGVPDALTGMDLVRLALERGGTAAAAVEVLGGLLGRYGQGGSGHESGDRPYWSSFLLADPGAAFVVETSGNEWQAQVVASTWATSNRTTIPAFDAAHRHPRQPVETLVDPRLAASRAVLEREPVSDGPLRQHLASHTGGDDGWTVCMHVDGVEATTASMVAALGVDDPQVWIALGPPCEVPFERVSFSS